MVRAPSLSENLLGTAETSGGCLLSGDSTMFALVDCRHTIDGEWIKTGNTNPS